MGKRMTKAGYIERVRVALTLPDAMALSSADYLDALEELRGDIDAMIDAKREEMAE